MASPALIVQVLIICVIVIVFLACSACNTSRDTNQDRQADEQQLPAADEAVQIAMALLDRVTYPRHCQSAAAAAAASAEDSAAAAALGSTETAAGTTEDCAICLGAFEDGDRCSIMPLCRHEFHRACIAGWLMAYNNTCPLCRAQLQWLAVAENMV